MYKKKIETERKIAKMHIMTDSDYNLFKSIVRLKQPALHKTLNSFLKRKYTRVVSTKEYLFAEGNIPICLVAHMDTVFKTPPENIYYDKDMGVIWSPEGGCGDDRSGVFAILKIVQSGLRPSVIFTTDEEVGGLGAEAIVKDFPVAPADFHYIVQLDRRGTNDCVFYDCANESFVQYIESFGFIENYGSFSDISELCPAWGIAGVNLSVGYENEHSVSETVHVNPLYKTITKVKRMLQEENIPEFKYIAGFYSKFLGLKSYYDWPNDEDDEEELIYHHIKSCSGCHKLFEDFEMIPVGDEYFCPDCCVDKVQWCTKCGTAFKRLSPSEKLCPKCLQEKGDNMKND